MNPMKATQTPGITRRNLLKALTRGGMMVAAAPVLMSQGWAWLMAQSAQAFTAMASSQIKLKKPRPGPRPQGGKGKKPRPSGHTPLAQPSSQPRKDGV